MSEKVSFSIVVPAYNRGESIGLTLNSVLNQVYTNWELIVVDDGSSDNTKEVVSRYVEKDKRISYIYQDNAERSAARNNGAHHAKNDFFIFLDSDDLFEKDHLKELAAFIDKHNSEKALYFTEAKVFKEGKIKKMLSTPSTNYDPEFFLAHSIIPARVSLHRELLDEFKFDLDCIVVEDTVLWCEICAKYPVYKCNTDHVLYHLHDDNSVNIKKYNAFSQRLKGLLKLFNQKEVGKSIPKAVKDKQIVNCYFGIARHHFYNKRKTKAIGMMLKSILGYPQIRSKEAIVAIKNILVGKEF